MAQASLAQARSRASGNVRRPAKYGLRLWTKTGLRTKSYRYAVFYEIRFGRDIIQDQKRFHSSTRTASQKQAYIERLVQRFELHRQAILAAKREEINRKARETRSRRARERAEAELKAQIVKEKKAQKAKERREAKKVEKERLEREKLELEEAAITEEAREGFEFFERLLKDFPELRQLAIETPRLINSEIAREDLAEYEPTTLSKFATISNVRVVPYTPKNRFYQKSNIYKTIETNNKFANVIILLFDLKKDFRIRLTDKSFDDVRLLSLYLFGPHFEAMFSELLANGDTFQIRIKYEKQHISGKIIKSAVAMRRRGLNSLDRLVKFYDDTFTRFLDKMQGQAHTYLEGDAILRITGFTLESHAYIK